MALNLNLKTNLFPQSQETGQGIAAEEDKILLRPNVSQAKAADLKNASISDWALVPDMTLTHESKTGQILILFNAVNYLKTGETDEAIYFVVYKDGVIVPETQRDTWHSIANANVTTTLIATIDGADKNTIEIYWKGDSALIQKNINERSLIVMDI